MTDYKQHYRYRYYRYKRHCQHCRRHHNRHRSECRYFNYYNNHRKKRDLTNTNHDNYVYIHFQLTQNDLPSEIDEANLRLMIKSHKIHHKHNISAYHDHTITLKTYQLIEPYGHILLDAHEIKLQFINNNMISIIKWIEFDVTRAIRNWLAGDNNLGFEIICDKCNQYNIYIVHDLSPYNQNVREHDDEFIYPRLNVIGKLMQHREKRSRQHRHFLQSSAANSPLSSSGTKHTSRHTRKTDCTNDNQKCCRHRMNVIFKEIKGFEFIIQPKTFDAGYCRGKCPPRYNPANHHAVLQSLIWKQNKNRAPRPCCAPSKLMELEVLHVDEDDSTKLKVSKWTDMRVLECACS